MSIAQIDYWFCAGLAKKVKAMLEQLSEFIFGTKAPERLPERVRLKIARQQIESEELISWAQLLLLVIFATLYFVSPKPDAPTNFQPVPVALGVYFSFTSLRLYLTRRGYLVNWLMRISIIMDMAFLMGLIWSYHIQYQQPPSFYLKSPTLIYVFIFIALRALRFEPRHIVLSGVAAVLGWMVLVLYVVTVDANDTMITRDYVVYMTSNAILVGAEFDKIIAISLVTAILATAVLRAQRVFENDMFDKSAADELSRFISPEVAHHITHADQAVKQGDAEIRDASVVFTDIEGFSTVSENMNPAELAGTLNEYFNTLSEIISNEGGVITQYQGDSMLITFGAVTANEDHVNAALRTALAIDEAVRDRKFGDGVRLKTRCGVNSGKIVIGAIGAQDRLVFTVHGDDVNVAARLESLCKEYGTYILVGEKTKIAATGNFNFSHVGDITVRGRRTPTTVYGVKSAKRD